MIENYLSFLGFISLSSLSYGLSPPGYGNEINALYSLAPEQSSVVTEEQSSEQAAMPRSNPAFLAAETPFSSAPTGLTALAGAPGVFLHCFFIRRIAQKCRNLPPNPAEGIISHLP